MKRRFPQVISLVIAHVVLVICVAAHAAQEQDVPWYHTGLVLLNGPYKESHIPEGKTAEDLINDFQPDVAEWSILPFKDGLANRPRGAALSIEWQEFPQTQQHLDDWRDTMGLRWTPTEENGVDREVNGNLLGGRKYGPEYPTTMWPVTQFCPKYHKYHIDDQVKQASKPGCGLVRQDNIGWPVGLQHAGGWGKYTLSAFKDWLSKRKNLRELKELGIDDLKTWDVRKALRKCYGDLSSALLREYVLFFNVSNAELWRDHSRAVKEKFPKMPLGGNQCHPAGLFPYRFALLSDVSDFLFLEGSASSDINLSCRLLRAGGRHSKPAWAWINSPTEISYYQAWGCGATPYLDLCTLRHNAQKGYYWLPKIPKEQYELSARVAAFAHKNREYLRPAFRAEADIAIIYSVPTMLYPACAAMGLDNEDFAATEQQINLAVYWAVRCNSQWNFEIFGHPAAWDDGDLDARLSPYKLVVLPNVAAISDAQYAALKRFRSKGGKIAVLGDFGLRREDYAKRKKPLALLDNIGLKPGEGANAPALKEAIGKYAVVCSDTTNVRINIFPKGDAYQIHFLSGGSTFTMEWPLPEGKGDQWETTWITPDEQSTGEFEIRDGKLFGRVHIKGPGWGFVHCQPSALDEALR